MSSQRAQCNGHRDGSGLTNASLSCKRGTLAKPYAIRRPVENNTAKSIADLRRRIMGRLLGIMSGSTLFAACCTILGVDRWPWDAMECVGQRLRCSVPAKDVILQARSNLRRCSLQKKNDCFCHSQLSFQIIYQDILRQVRFWHWITPHHDVRLSNQYDFWHGTTGRSCWLQPYPG